jgi:hypothetical protein
MTPDWLLYIIDHWGHEVMPPQVMELFKEEGTR